MVEGLQGTRDGTTGSCCATLKHLSDMVTQRGRNRSAINMGVGNYWIRMSTLSKKLFAVKPATVMAAFNEIDNRLAM